MIANLEALTETANTAARDINRLQNEVLTRENVNVLRDSVVTLTKTLEHVEVGSCVLVGRKVPDRQTETRCFGALRK